MCRDSHGSLRGIPSVWLSNSFMAEGSHSASQPALFCSVCLISQFTRCFIGSYYGRHGDAIRFNGILFWGAESVIKGEKYTQPRRQRLTKPTPAEEKSPVPPNLLLHPPPLFIGRSKRRRPTFAFMWNTDGLTLNCPLWFRTSGSDQRASYKRRPLGLLITVLLNPGSDSSQRMSLCLLNTGPLPPFLRRTTLTFKEEVAPRGAAWSALYIS